MIIGFVAKGVSSVETKSVSSHSILQVDLSGSISEYERSKALEVRDFLSNNIEDSQPLNILIESLKEGSNNKNIDALYIQCDGVSASPATLHALRVAVEQFKESGKKVIAYGDNLTQSDYYVASVADEIYLNPQGSLMLTGYSGTSLYLKDLFDKLGVQFQVVKVGKFKSAVEPYILNEMSTEARLQLDSLYGTMWQFVKEDISKSRNIQPSQIDSLINRDIILAKDAKFVKQNKLVSGLLHKREVMEKLASMQNIKVKDLNFVEPSLLINQSLIGKAYSSKKQVAVLYASGEISESTENGINCENLVPIIIDLANDDNVKGLVLRVNSPGGSVFGSEQISDALSYFKSKGKPFAVSMGDYAASGGYWISCGADKIFADPLTITGSIGIYGLFPNINGMENKIGVNPQVISTNRNGVFSMPLVGLNDEQLAAMQQMVNEGYDQFITKVATGRKMKPEKVREIGEGRVWSAITAVNLGLVDQLGQLKDAADWVAKKSKLDTTKYDITYYPQYNPGFLDYINLNNIISQASLSVELKDNYYLLMKAKDILSRNPIQARMMEINTSL
jgi:protease-4